MSKISEESWVFFLLSSIFFSTDSSSLIEMVDILLSKENGFFIIVLSALKSWKGFLIFFSGEKSLNVLERFNVGFCVDLISVLKANLERVEFLSCPFIKVLIVESFSIELWLFI